jgi:hypothetical protein
MPNPPKVFISAASGDLGNARQAVKEALLDIGCHPVEQMNFPPDYRTVANMLREKIEGCQALIHIAGIRYGTEPDPTALPNGAMRRSYTQLEYDIARELAMKRGDRRFRVYSFVCPEGFPYDAEPDVEATEKRELQRRHRQPSSMARGCTKRLRTSPPSRNGFGWCGRKSCNCARRRAAGRS